MARSKTYQMLLKIAGDSSSLKKACEAASEHLDTLGNAAKAAGKVATTALAGIGTAAAGIAVAATSVYTEHEKAANSLAAATGATGKELENLQSAMETVHQNNFGESIEDAASAVSLVSRNIKDLPDQEIASAAEAAIALRDAFEYDAEESTRAAAVIRKNFGGSAEEAFGLIAAGAQNGLDYSGELIDTINEYSSQFSKLGFSADGMFQLLQSGADSTAWNLDKVGDAVKEFSIRAIDGSDTTVAAFEALGYNAATMMDTFAAGGDGANQAFFDVLNTLMDMEDQVARDALGVSLFGTMWEDLGTEAMEAMANASAGAYDEQHFTNAEGLIVLEGLNPGAYTVQEVKPKNGWVADDKELLGWAKGKRITAGPVFQTSGGKTLDRSNIWREMKGLCGAAGVDSRKVFPHNLRHLFAVLFYKVNKDIAKLADILGHTSISTTRIYIMETSAEHERQLAQLGLVV